MCGPTTTTTSKSSSTADGSSAGATTTTTTTNYYLGWSQVQTLLWKTVLSKVRTPIGTFFEIFSPLLLILVLVLAFQLSEISTRDAAQYTSIDLEFPGPWITLVGFVTDLIGTNSTGGGIIDLGGVFPDSTTRRQLVSKLIKEEEQQQGSGGSGGGGGPIQAAFQKFPMLQEITESYGELYGFSSIFGEKEEVEEEIHPLHTILSKQQQSRRHLQTTSDDDNTNTTDDDDDVFDFLGDASSEIRDLLTNPFPVPTFGQYIMASQALTSFLLDPDDLPIILSQSSFGRSWGNLLTLGTLHISSSSSSIAEEFVNYLENEFPLVLIEIMDESSSSNNSTTTAEEEAAAAASVKVRFHESEEMAVRFINDNLDERTWALIDFTNNVEEEESMEFQIRMNYTTLPNTNQIVNYIARGLSTRYERYYLSGYLTLQRTIDEFAMSRVGGCTTTTDNNPEEEVAFDTNILSMPMPTAAFEQNVFFTAVGYLLGLTIAMAFLYPTSRMIKMMVEEKESRMKETLFILGVRPWAHWLSWFVSSNGTFLLSAILVSWALTTSILTNSNAIYLYIFIGAFATSTVGFCFVVGACFSRAKLAAIVGPMAFFATLLPRFIFFGSNRYESTNGKVLASLLPCTAFAFGADIVADYEYAEVGIQSWNASEGEYSFNTAIGMLLFDTVLFTFLGWYLDLVIPRQFGVARPWYFLLTPRYWWSVFVGCFGSSSLGTTSSTATMEKQQQQQGQEDSSSSSSSSTDNFEPILDDALTPTVFIQNLVKKYNRKANRAVDDLNLTLYESQITCLLGHNGAGKTTTISILTGLFPPTSGDCSIYGNSIVHNPNNIRQSMGICPQHNVLFDRLTVTEHLYLFQKIKGLSPTSDHLVDSAVEVGLGEYHQTTSQALSGGNKRKLSLAIALCGNPQFLVLDEPTSGMDVESRRHCWELLRRRSKEGRGVTTL